MKTGKAKVIYTLTDEAPLLATCSLLPIIRTFTAPAGIDIVKSDISLSARILAEFSDYLAAEQKVPDNLAELGRLTQNPETNIIKLPNISASAPQLIAAVRELQSRDYKIPNYPEELKTDEDKALRERCADGRSPDEYAAHRPHRPRSSRATWRSRVLPRHHRVAPGPGVAPVSATFVNDDVYATGNHSYNSAMSGGARFYC